MCGRAPGQVCTQRLPGPGGPQTLPGAEQEGRRRMTFHFQFYAFLFALSSQPARHHHYKVSAFCGQRCL